MCILKSHLEQIFLLHSSARAVCIVPQMFLRAESSETSLLVLSFSEEERPAGLTRWSQAQAGGTARHVRGSIPAPPHWNGGKELRESDSCEKHLSDHLCILKQLFCLIANNFSHKHSPFYLTLTLSFAVLFFFTYLLSTSWLFSVPL